MKDSTFTSRDRWPIWLWLFSLFLTGSLAVAIQVALGNNPAGAAAVALTFLLFWAALSTPLPISLDDKYLRVGGASIERSFISKAVPLSARDMALTRGREADARCWMALRFWVSSGVKVEINDPRDPTPYWLVSAKRATELAAALNTGD